ncbi:hypothetical protein [Gordonia rubripertincta]|uniref:Uncharacterized protein n=1 Tax=Gordonia rubripertincta TaxID=36822 RepID=A0ABT4N5X3_GORRU|nr:hypothetical protein [Gordonia rubripertincta]MCZ4553676.1 hypothetical protein [Gordonia rubripertincta]
MDINDVANRINPRRAQLALAHIMAGLGAYESWSPAHLEWIADDAKKAWTGTALPSFTDQGSDAAEFWAAVIDTAPTTELADPLTRWAEIFGDPELADEIAVALNCTEADATAAALTAAGNPQAASTFLAAHTARDTSDGETHS